MLTLTVCLNKAKEMNNAIFILLRIAQKEHSSSEGEELTMSFICARLLSASVLRLRVHSIVHTAILEKGRNLGPAP